MKKVTTHQAKTHLSRLLKEVQGGETVVILNSNVPVAKLTSIEPSEEMRPTVGMPTSEPVHYTDDAFQPLTEEELQDWGL